MTNSMSLAPTRERWLHTLLIYVFVLPAVLIGSAHPRRPTQRISPELQSPKSASSFNVIAQFNQVPTDKQYNLDSGITDHSDLVDPAAGTALSPTVSYDRTTGQVSIVYDAAAVWGTWTYAAVWGTSVRLNGTTALWGTAAVWGAGTTGGFSPVEGTAAV